MNPYAFIQIILYVFAGILAVVGIFNKTGNDKSISRYDKIIIIGIILTLGFSILLEVIKADAERDSAASREQDHKQYIDSLTKIIAKSDVLLIRTDSTLGTQALLQKRTDSLLNITNEISGETQGVLNNTSSVMQNQKEDFANYGRDKNPLFPMKVSIDLSISFDEGDFSKRLLDSFYNYKKTFEEGASKEDNNVRAIWKEAERKISSISFYGLTKTSIIFQKYPSLRFLNEKAIEIKLQTEPDESLSDAKKSLIFAGFFSLSVMGDIGGKSWITIDYEKRQIYFNCEYDGITLLEPTKYKPIGTKDLYDNYIIVHPRQLCNYVIHSINMRGGNSNVYYSSSIIFSETDSRKIENCKYYFHKIKPEEVRTRMASKKQSE
jgi:hypothetical protein